MKKIVFDPGHRNNNLDWGAAGNGLREAEVAMEIVNHAVKYLNDNYTGHAIKLTRSSNNQIIDLNLRDDVANKWGADVFVSVHLNAFNKKANGFETFIFNGEVSSGTISLQNMLHSEIFEAMKKFGSVVDRGKKRANHSVTRTTAMPAVLTENLFIDSTDDAALLKKPGFLKAVGEAHAIAVAKFLGLKEVNNVMAEKPQVKPETSKDSVDDWAAESWEKAQKKIGKDGKTPIMNGQNPNDPITRKQFAAVLDRLGLLDK